ncbi:MULTISPECIES: aminotransferase class I/II-fold pyridoxal phosphate-dependent enzyme [Brochothrix]|uniref:Aminotransferase n=1 Tax=Brochothrix thermosphacta TaxID=2756 RepID=A0A2X0QQA9_BROTH|nr:MULTISPECIES: aminotransferase class I/II-fold pyridoxal phosphate-dependent enzyme [Brochothrix]SLM95467.1 Aspartate aminotransferase [Brachybacterium faecium]MBR5526146.1 aminotransferase class I/II-fold pyridoxal phosphate-dependent enzyme [Brochothrix sp.]MDO7864519.1 aminotransferase class I/II-fold pyridoxal phosphate-dependent enzyme [Brochothrix thermosphacta]WKK69472.1 aminotransferase class I/II-fold pyridoxal phosphate-dependent enzyme [Brochothrix thermosphacta]SPP26022.1 N-acet
MVLPLNRLVDDIEISGIRQFSEKVGIIPNIIPLTLGAPDFPTPDHIKTAAKAAIDNNITNYTPNAGFLSTRQAAAAYFKKKYSLDYDPLSEVVITVGATEAISLALSTVLNPGDEVLVPDPLYPGYTAPIHLAGAEMVVMDTTVTEFKVTPAMLDNYVTEKTKVLILAYPCNPTGVTYTKEEAIVLAAKIKELGIYLIADEIYSELTYGEEHYSLAREIREQTIVLNGLSKSHAMTGWRIGVLMAPESIVRHVLKIHQVTTTCATSISQIAAEEAFSNGFNDSLEMREAYRQRRDYVQPLLEEMGFDVISPDGAFYFFIKLPEYVKENSYDFAVAFAEQYQVAIIPGDSFSQKGDRYLRISYAASMDHLKIAMERLKQMMASYH